MLMFTLGVLAGGLGVLVFFCWAAVRHDRKQQKLRKATREDIRS